MKHIPWKKIAIACTVLAVLVLARSIATVGRAVYFGSSNAMAKLWHDPWTYVGFAAAAVGLVALLTWKYGEE